ncbi:hypothetical protein ABZP36_016773 [Zizania latifolia]
MRRSARRCAAGSPCQLPPAPFHASKPLAVARILRNLTKSTSPTALLVRLPWRLAAPRQRWRRRYSSATATLILAPAAVSPSPAALFLAIFGAVFYIDDEMKPVELRDGFTFARADEQINFSWDSPASPYENLYQSDVAQAS